VAAGFGLPVGVDDRAAALADVLVVPDPRFGVDGLADGAEELQAGHVVLAARSSPHFMNVRMAVGAV
jgi:hypothetical protein